jgi:type IV pilus assembly protein PilA
MLKAIQNKMRDDKGFTLIELMVVVLIIAILIAIAIPTFLGMRRRAQDRAAQSNLRNGITAAKAFYTDNDSYSGFTVLAAEAVEPSLFWQTAALTAPPPENQVHIDGETGTGTGQVAHLIARSNSGTFFCVRDSGGATTFGSGAAVTDVDTAAGCAADSW